MWYNYKLLNGQEVGWYQCDLVDFKKLWKKMKKEISSCLVKLDNGESWLYVKTIRRDRFVGVNGWSRVGFINSLKNKVDYK